MCQINLYSYWRASSVLIYYYIEKSTLFSKTSVKFSKRISEDILFENITEVPLYSRVCKKERINSLAHASHDELHSMILKMTHAV